MDADLKQNVVSLSQPDSQYGDGLACLAVAWQQHERELRRWLCNRVGDQSEAEDVLQDTFLKALRQGPRFCALDNPRAWLFEVARNTLADRIRKARHELPVPDDLISEDHETEAVDGLAACLPRALSELRAEDRDIIQCCDLAGTTQADYAHQHQLSLPAVKSRLLRARCRLRSHLVQACQVHFDGAGQVCCFVPRSPDERAMRTKR